MIDGPGKYDELCTMVRTLADAKLALVLVLGGSRGEGFSVQMQVEPSERPEALRALAQILREVASQIDADAGAQS